MQFDITIIFMAVLLIIAIICSRYLIPFLKEKLNNEQINALTVAIDAGVYWAQQTMKTATGAEKLAAVINYLAERGFVVDVAKVSNMVLTMIEAAVKKLKLQEEAAGEHKEE